MLSTAARSAPDDSALVLAMTRGETAAMSALYDRYAPNLLGLALRITREQADAEEVVVDTFAQAWREASRFEAGRGSVAAWLATIARSRALDTVRSRTRRGRLADAAEAEVDSAPAMGSGFASPVANLLADERSRRVRDAMMALPDAQRATLDLAYFEGLSQSEIAERLGEPLGTIKTRVRLGLRKLRELLTALGPEGYA
ncbi:MAG: sigma-70 family RNA polymerase sigma factor [Gemmatimonadota bacterium]